MIIQNGSQVQLHYTLTIDNEVVDTSHGDEPLQYVHGQGEIVPGLEAQLTGRRAGDKLDATVDSEQAYGPFDPAGVHEVPTSAFEQIEELEVGGVVSGEVDGRPFTARVVAIAPETVTLDLNHPLAGKTLHFAVEIVSVA